MPNLEELPEPGRFLQHGYVCNRAVLVEGNVMLDLIPKHLPIWFALCQLHWPNFYFHLSIAVICWIFENIFRLAGVCQTNRDPQESNGWDAEWDGCLAFCSSGETLFRWDTHLNIPHGMIMWQKATCSTTSPKPILFQQGGKTGCHCHGTVAGSSVCPMFPPTLLPLGCGSSVDPLPALTPPPPPPLPPPSTTFLQPYIPKKRVASNAQQVRT